MVGGIHIGEGGGSTCTCSFKILLQMLVGQKVSNVSSNALKCKNTYMHIYVKMIGVLTTCVTEVQSAGKKELSERVPVHGPLQY